MRSDCRRNLAVDYVNYAISKAEKGVLETYLVFLIEEF